MDRNAWWKTCLLLGLLLVAVVYTLPNLFGEDFSVQIYSSGENLGSLLEQVKENLVSEQVRFVAVTSENNGRVLVRCTNEEDQLKVKETLERKLPGDYTVALNLASRNPKWLQMIGARPMKLGLDLRGGVHFLLSVDLLEIMGKRGEDSVRAMALKLRELGIYYRSIVRDGSHGVRVYFRSSEELKKGYESLSKYFSDYIFSKDGTHGESYVLLAKMSDVATKKLADYAIEQTMMTLRNRVNELGVSEAVVQRQGEFGISVDLPGVHDTARAKELLGKTATLRFHLLDETNDVREALVGHLPLGSHLYYYRGQPLLLKDQVVLHGDSITYAMANYSQFGKPVVQVRLGSGRENNFAKVTGENIGRYMAVVYVEYKSELKKIDGEIKRVRHSSEKIISVARIQSALGSQFEITGLSEKQAQNLAVLLRSGSLIAPVTVEQEITVGPSMGKANIYKGVLSIGVGYACIMLFMGIYYRVFGCIANLALVMNLIFVSAVMSVLGATLTMPGIAGMVLTAGLAVDACVLIFERIREELRLGAGVRSSIYAGYQRALAAIIDANMATLIIALVLFAFGDGAVKGFAVTLFVGLLSSMLTTIVYSRAIVNWLFVNGRSIKTLPIGI